jgi:aminopeptidase-like protein
MTSPTQVLMEQYFDRLWPINRSITGKGLRKSLAILADLIPTEALRFRSGEKIFDWSVPKEWNVNEAYVADSQGTKVIDFKKHNLHLVGYSSPINTRISLEDLTPHLYTIPSKPDAIPYVTSYFNETWGFCLTHHEFQRLSPGEYHVVIDSELSDGHLEIGEALIPGDSQNEILWSTYLCHPSMANNELSGPLVLAFLYDYIRQSPNRYFTHRFLLSTETIGTLCFLKQRGDHLREFLRGGFVLTCLGTKSSIIYKQSRNGQTFADKIASIILQEEENYTIVPFDPFGSDERQYCSPGFNLPMGTLMRDRPGEYPEYHTSLDNKDIICFSSLERSFTLMAQIADAMEANKTWRSTVMMGEPQLGKRGIYPSLRSALPYKGHNEPIQELKMIKWLINLSDGQTDLLSIAKRSKYRFTRLAALAEKLHDAGLLVTSDDSRNSRTP